MKEAKTIAHLVAETDFSRTRLANAILAQEPAALEVEGVCGSWSIKDIMAHTTAWEQRMMEWLDQILLDHAGVTFLEDELAGPAVDEYNRRVFLFHRSTDVQKIKKAFLDHHQLVLDYIARLPEEPLFKKPDVVFEEEHPLWHLVAANTFWHYEEHLEQIERQPWYQKPKEIRA